MGVTRCIFAFSLVACLKIALSKCLGYSVVALAAIGKLSLLATFLLGCESLVLEATVINKRK